MMSSGLPSIILDADVVINLKEMGLWDKVVTHYNIILPKVIQHEAKYYYPDKSGMPNRTIEIDWKNEDVEFRDLELTEIIELDKSIPPYAKIGNVPMIEEGERQCLAMLGNTEAVLCLKDGLAIRMAVFIDVIDRVISVEELLKPLGKGPKLPYEFSQKRFDSEKKEAETIKIQNF